MDDNVLLTDAEKARIMVDIAKVLRKTKETIVTQQDPTPTSTSYVIDNKKLGFTVEYMYIPATNRHLVLKDNHIIEQQIITESRKEKNKKFYKKIIKPIEKRFGLTNIAELMAEYDWGNRR